MNMPRRIPSLCLYLITWITLEGMLATSVSGGSGPACKHGRKKSEAHAADAISAAKPMLTLEFGSSKTRASVTSEGSTAADEAVSDSESTTVEGTETQSAASTLLETTAEAGNTSPNTASETSETPSTNESELPSPPAFFRVLPLSDTSVLLTWLPVPTYIPGSRYRVRAVTSDDETPWLDVGLAMTVRINDVDPAKNHTYEVQWCSEDDVCSRSADVFSPATAPRLPTVQNLTLVNVDESSINVTWDADASGASDGFLVAWCMTLLCYSKSQTKTNQTSIVISGLRDYTSYTILVNAYIDTGFRAFTGKTQNVTARTEPSPPQRATSVPWGFNGITLLWLPKYQQVWGSRYRARVVAPVRTPGKWMVTSSTMLTFSGLSPSTAYEFELEWCPSAVHCSRPVAVQGSTL